MTVKNPLRNTPEYRRAVKALKARAPVQLCWSCGKKLYAHLRYPHPLCITLGHFTAIEDGGHPIDPSNHGPQCVSCNMGDGARRTNAKRGEPKHVTITSSPGWK